MMIEIMTIAIVLLLLVVIILQIVFRGSNAGMEEAMREEISRSRDELNTSLRENRQELMNSFVQFSGSNDQKFHTFRENIGDSLEKIRETVNQNLKSVQEDNQRKFDEMRQELLNSFVQFSGNNDQKFHTFREGTLSHLEKIRETIDQNLKSIQEDNRRKLDEMRQVVDEKLRESVEKRFNESFKLISDRLDQVHKGLGEMQNLASGVGDLKKVLTNVKTRGNLGELQLSSILEQCLSPDQYAANVTVKPNSLERVEFAVKMPGRSDGEEPLYLPIDAKFPLEDYQRLLDAYETGVDLEPSQRAFETAVRKSSREISDKYINPPFTTDFAILFVPTEGLYAEILRRGTLFETLHRDYKIAVVGPANLMAFLNSLQMGFRTLAIEKRSSEVWNILGAIKTEFGRFGDVLEKTRKKLELAANEISNAGVRTRAIQRKLRDVQELPAVESSRLLGDVFETEAASYTDDEA